MEVLLLENLLGFITRHHFRFNHGFLNNLFFDFLNLSDLGDTRRDRGSSLTAGSISASSVQGRKSILEVVFIVVLILFLDAAKLFRIDQLALDSLVVGIRALERCDFHFNHIRLHFIHFPQVRLRVHNLLNTRCWLDGLGVVLSLLLVLHLLEDFLDLGVQLLAVVFLFGRLLFFGFTLGALLLQDLNLPLAVFV